MRLSKHDKVNIHWTPKKGSGIPLYLQIVQYIAHQIQSGDWTVGDRLPSQREMAILFGVNRSTVVTAMEELTAYGIIESDHGGGTRVSGGSWSLLMAQPPDWNKYIQSGSFRENKATIQTINRVEAKTDYIRLSSGELAPELYPQTLLADSFRKMPDRISSLNYLGPLGLPELRRALCERLQTEYQISVLPEHILITSGSLQALQLISLCMLKRGANAYTETPSYLRSLQVFQSAGLQMHGVPMDEEGMLVDTLRATDMMNSMIYTIPTFQNPTGRLMSPKRRVELLRFCREKSIPLIEDNAYGALWLDSPPPAPLKAMDSGGNVLYLGTISKTMAPGLRLGWCVGPEPVIYRLGDVKMQTDYGSSSVSQWLLTDLLSGSRYDDYLAKLRRQLCARRNHALSVLDESFSDFATWEKPAGGFYIWLRLKKRLPMEAIFRDALAQGILINPGNVYDYAENHAIRLSYSYASPDEFRDAAGILAEILETYDKKTAR